MQFSKLMRQLITWIALAVPAVCAAQYCPPGAGDITQRQLAVLMKEAKDRGFLWRIEKDGRVGHLFGSMHLGKPGWMVPGPKTMAALNAAEVVALELDILDPEIQATIADPSRSGIKSLALPPALQRRMSAAARKVCAPEGMLPKLHPILQLVTVTVLEARFAELETAYGSEFFLAGFARGAGKPVVSLETAQSQLRALLDGAPKEIFDGIERALALMEKGQSRVVTERLAAAWASGNLTDIALYTEWCACAETDQDRRALLRLNDDRNPGLAAGIDKLMRSNKSVFAAVGALHMVGAKALPKLLQEMGHKVERVAFEP